MKKRFILCSLVVAGMLFGQSATYATEYDEDTYQPYVRSVDFLKGMGIADIDTVNYDEEITRARAAYYMSSIFGDMITYSDVKGVFTDVSADTQYAKEIEALASYGIIHGYDDGSYRPDETATLTDVASMAVYALGLEYEAVANGASAASYLAVASANDILDSVKATDGYVTLGDIAVIMYNTLHGEIADYDMSTSDHKYTKTDESLLYRNFDVVYDEGVIIKNDITALWASTDLGDGMIEVETNKGNLLIDASESDVWKDIGKKVRIYYNCEKDVFEYAYHEYHKQNAEFSIDFQDIEFGKSSLKNGEISYSENGKEKRKKIEKNYSLIFNNMYYAEAEFSFDDYKGKAGNATLIDNDGDNVYDVVSIKAYDTIFVDSVVEADMLIFDKTDKKLSVSKDESKYDKIVITDADGKKADFSDITSGNVISVAKSSDNTKEKAIEIIIGKDYVTGKVSSVQTGDYTTAVIDNMNEYIVLKKAESDIFIGQTITGYFDAFGNIAYIDTVSGRDWQYGICIKNILADDEKFSLRIITLNGNIEELPTTEKVRIDGETVSDTAKMKSTLDKAPALKVEAEAKGVYVLRYRLSEDGKIKEIDTLNKGKETSDNFLTLAGNGTLVKCSGNILGWAVPYEADTRVITVSSSIGYADSASFNDQRNISVGTAALEIRYVGRLYSVAAFKSGADEAKADFIVRLNDMSYTWDNEFFVVESVKEEYNEEFEEVMLCINGYTMGVEKKYWVGDDRKEAVKAKGFVLGDVLRCVVDGNGKMLNEEAISKYNPDGSVTITKCTGLDGVTAGELVSGKSSSVTIQNGFVYSRDADIIATTYTAFGNVQSLPTDINWKSEQLYYSSLSGGVVVTVVDTSKPKNKVFSGSVDDVKDYLHQADECSRALLRWRSNTLKEVVIFNR